MYAIQSFQHSCAAISKSSQCVLLHKQGSRTWTQPRLFTREDALERMSFGSSSLGLKLKISVSAKLLHSLRTTLAFTAAQEVEVGNKMPAPEPFVPVKTQLLVSDFDESFSDADTDRWVHEVLSPRLRRKFEDIGQEGTMQFTDMCASLLVELHKEGHTPEDILTAQSKVYVHPSMVRGVKALKSQASPRTECFLLSNSNEVYLEAVLKANGLYKPQFELFTEIVTNPAHFEPNGLLKLSRRVSPDGPQHGCKVGCSANMCKGDELEAYLERHGGRSSYDRLIYLGDGANDFCPVLRFGPKDVALVRKGKGLERRIRQEGGVKCEVRYWKDAWEVEELFDALRGQS